MLTPNEHRMHPSYFPNDDGAMLVKALPSTKSYQAPMTGSDAANPFLGMDDQDEEDANMAFNKQHSLHLLMDESNSQSTVNPPVQYYYHKQNGQIGFGQMSQSRASDRIYDRAAHEKSEASPDAKGTDHASESFSRLEPSPDDIAKLESAK